MSKFISARLRVLLGGFLVAIGCVAVCSGAATAAPATVAYNNLNTVPATVNGLPNEDTFSQDFEFFPVGGQIETIETAGRVVKSLTTQLDSFVCEHGVYSLENCFTAKPNKKFAMTWTASIYRVAPGNEVGSLVASSTQTFKLKFRPTTNVSCPKTNEGKGFGANCDVGGYLNTVTFKKFGPAGAILPSKVIILLTNSCGGCEGKPVNVGVQTSYKEFNESKNEFVGEPPANGGVPEVGSDPLPKEGYENGTLKPGFENFQPVFKLVVH